MKNTFVLFTTICVLSVNYLTLADPIMYIDDGGSHTFNDDTYRDLNVYLDYYTSNNPGTHIDLANGGSVLSLQAHNNASITMTGGSVSTIGASEYSTVAISGGLVTFNLIGVGNSLITITDGMVPIIELWHNSTANMKGGTVASGIVARDNSHITMSGGTVGDYGLSIHKNGIIYLDGSDFMVNGRLLSYGDKLSDFGILVENGNYDYYFGRITGILSDGSPLDNEFTIRNLGNLSGTGNIVLIPEPATLLLFALGGLMLRKRIEN